MKPPTRNSRPASPSLRLNSACRAVPDGTSDRPRPAPPARLAPGRLAQADRPLAPLQVAADGRRKALHQRRDEGIPAAHQVVAAERRRTRTGLREEKAAVKIRKLFLHPGRRVRGAPLPWICEDCERGSHARRGDHGISPPCQCACARPLAIEAPERERPSWWERVSGGVAAGIDGSARGRARTGVQDCPVHGTLPPEEDEDRTEQMGAIRFTGHHQARNIWGPPPPETRWDYLARTGIPESLAYVAFALYGPISQVKALARRAA